MSWTRTPLTKKALIEQLQALDLPDDAWVYVDGAPATELDIYAHHFPGEVKRYVVIA